MKHSKDPFEAAIEEEQEESPQESPVSGGGVGGGGNDDGLVEIDQTPEESERDVSVRRQNKKCLQGHLSQFTEDQMSRYESFRRSALQKGNMRKVMTLEMMFLLR